ncbi:hypothetical protein ACHAP8_008499 [Fusarium lateritium]
MPTTHVSPKSQEELKDIANGLLKARKVIVVTGAGISTNSGIPDFRSENGLYSLISTQLDAAQRARLQENTADDEPSDSDSRPAPKRRKILRDDSPKPEEDSGELRDEIEVQLEDPDPVEEEIADTIQVEGHPHDEEQPEDPDAMPMINPRTTRSTIAVAQPPTSPLSSPPPEDFRITPPSAFRRARRSHLHDSGIPPSSSPLSSPPPILFEPFSSHASEDDGPGSRSSTSPSEVDDTPPSLPPSLSQTNIGTGKNTLPNMKGKDMFDASIWADPLRTSVFYTFATTLRQKVRDVEPTSSHRFISHLRDRGKLVRCYTQNIDQIEEKVGLSTCLTDGPGSRGRFSRKSTANLNQLNRMVDEVNAMTEANSQQSSDNEASQQSQSSQLRPDIVIASQAESDLGAPEDAMATVQSLRRDLPKSGVECVFLHGSLELLRCFLCGRVCSWDDEGRQLETMSGQQPECPHCVGATVAREERGKRALGVGKLRPDIVLYGEEHPNAHLISPIVTHDLALCPDLLLILGTSLRVHGLKVMVREFAKAVHAKGGKVVFVNYTKPPESSWGDVIDYWVEWDCDAWVSDLQEKIPKLWQTPDPPRLKKKRDSGGAGEEGEKMDAKRCTAANPIALRDTKATGAYWVPKIMRDLHRITGHGALEPREIVTPVIMAAPIELPPAPAEQLEPPPSKPVAIQKRARRSRRSAPGALEKTKKPPSTLNPNHGRTLRSTETAEPPKMEDTEIPFSHILRPEKFLRESSIIDSVKGRVRKRRRIDGEEVELPSVGRRQSSQKAAEVDGSLRLPPLNPQPPIPHTSPPFERLVPMEPPHCETTPKYYMNAQLQPVSPVAAPNPGPLKQVSHNTSRRVTRSQKSLMGVEEPHSPFVTGYPPERSLELYCSLQDTYSLVMKPGLRQEESNALAALHMLKNGPAHEVMAQDFVNPPQSRVQTRSSSRLRNEGV